MIPARPGAVRDTLFLAGALAVVGAVFVAGLPEHVRDVDVLLYASAAARANAEGALPYVAAWIEKGPLAMGLFQALFAAFGAWNMLAVALTWLALAWLGTGLSWLLGRELAGTAAGGWAALLFAVAVGPLGGTLNTEVPASVAAAAAVLLWCRSARGPRSRPGLAAVVGVLAAVAMLCRQNAGALWPLLTAAEGLLAVLGLRAWRAAAVHALAIGAAFLATAGAVVAVYAAAGAMEPFLWCVYGYNTDIYVAATRVDAFRVLIGPWTAFRNFLLPSPITGIAGLAGAVGALVGPLRGRRDPRTIRTAVVACVALGLTASLFLGLRFFSHYFALVLPLWAALGGWAAAGVAARLGSRGRIALVAVALVAVALPLGGVDWRTQAWRVKVWLTRSGTTGPGDALHWPGRDALSARVARFLREHGDDRDRVFVWGMRPHVYVYARRTPATRFVTCTFLTGLVPWERSAPEDDTKRWIVPGAWDLLMADLESGPPEFVVDASHDHLFGDGGYAVDRFPRLRDFLEARYAVVFEAGDGDRMIVWRRISPGRPLRDATVVDE